MMKKSMCWLFLGLALWTAPAWSKDDTLTVHCNGKPIKVEAVLRNGVAYYPIDELAAAAGTRVDWNPITKELRINNSGVEVAPIYLGGKLYLPLDTFAAAAGCTNSWDPGAGTVVMKRISTNMPNSADNVATPTRPGSFVDGRELPYDATLDGRLPGGWQFANPIEPPRSASAPMAPDAGSVAVLQRAESNTGDVFVPRSARNSAFQISVTNVERLSSFRGYYQARSGYKFFVVYVSQKNVSGTPQVYPGKFHIQDSSGNAYEPMEELGSFWAVIMKPYGVNFGYLVYELPENTFPSQLVLTTVGLAPLSVNL